MLPFVPLIFSNNPTFAAYASPVNDNSEVSGTKLAAYLKNVCNQDLTFFENVFAGKQDPWEKLKANDINSQMVQFAKPADLLTIVPHKDLLKS